MDAATYQTVKRLYLEARALDRQARRAFLDERCGQQEELRAEVEGLLGQEETLGGFMERPARLERDADDDGAHPLPHPDRIGAYRILKPLGFGGMGVVYLAEQDSPKRAVALKLLRLDSASPRQLERFEREAELLGRLSHPGIARVYEAGWAETETGRRPFFAMEYVEGRALNEFANERELDTAARLEIFCRVAEAAHFAHERGVVHRDLKPSNVLVDERGEPKVLDFGVARPLGSDSNATQTGQLVGTLAYMSPEQAAAREIDARSDVYTLGVMLYELLTGRLPIPTEGLALHEAVRRIREEEPIAAGAVRRELRGDLETVLGKAMAKEPGRRYATAAELAEDLRLFLDNRPIRARRPTSLYVGWKLVRRHRMLAASIVALFVALSVTQFFSMRLIQRSRELAQAEEQRRFYQELELRSIELHKLEALERDKEYLKGLDAPVLLEKWVADVRLLLAELGARRAERDRPGSWHARLEKLPGTPEEVLRFLDAEDDIVNCIESLTGPRGLPEILARIEGAHAASAATTSGEETP